MVAARRRPQTYLYSKTADYALSLNLPRIDLAAGYLHNRVLLLQPLKLLVLSRKLLLIVFRRIAPATDQPVETDLPTRAGN